MRRPRPDMLIGICTTRADRDIFLQQGWYRVPVSSWPRRNWTPTWLALFETGAATGGRQQILHFGRITAIRERTGAELFPGVPRGGKESRRYHQLLVETPLQRAQPIYLDRARRNPFLLTTHARFQLATTINELIVGTTLEESMWDALRQHRIQAEREWLVDLGRRRYWLDFALMCRARNIDIEVDGDEYHLTPEKAEYDNNRNNELESRGWAVLRFTTSHVQRRMDHAIATIHATINKAEGLISDGIVPRRFFPGAAVQQLAMFEEQAPYDPPPEP